MITKCSYCGEFVEQNLHSCPHCGAPLLSSTTVSQTEANAMAKKIDLFIACNAEKLPSMLLSELKKILLRADKEKCEMVLLLDLKDPSEMLLISLFVGGFGVDRFMLGEIVSGVCKLLFGWLTLGIWWLVDVIRISEKTKKYNYKMVTQLL